jgi:hypothetical protein
MEAVSGFGWGVVVALSSVSVVVALVVALVVRRVVSGVSKSPVAAYVAGVIAAAVVAIVVFVVVGPVVVANVISEPVSVGHKSMANDHAMACHSIMSAHLAIDEHQSSNHMALNDLSTEYAIHLQAIASHGRISHERAGITIHA